MGGERIKPRKRYSFSDGVEITLVEQNVVLSKWWWVLIFINVLSGLAAQNDFDGESWARKIIKLRLFQIKDDIEILISSSGEVGGVRGVGNSVVLGTVTEQCPLVAKRIKRYKIGLKIFAFLLLSAVAAVIALILYGIK
jgi:hypothetical protein